MPGWGEVAACCSGRLSILEPDTVTPCCQPERHLNVDIEGVVLAPVAPRPKVITPLGVTSRMPYQPVSGDHAIQQVTFTVKLTQVATRPDLQELRKHHRLWREELPAVANADGLTFQIDATTGLPQTPSNVVGIEFAFMRPDNTPAWKLRVLGPEVVVDCFRYTRWAKTWDRASRYFLEVLALLTKPQPEREIRSVSLLVVDRFKADALTDGPAGCLRESPLLSSKLFHVGPLWHQQSGWFSQPLGAGSRILNQLNLAATQQAPLGDETDQELILTIQHVQEWSPDVAQPLRKAVESRLASLNAAMQIMHDENKSVVTALLDPVMLERIGLRSEAEL